MTAVVETPSEAVLGWGTLLQRGDEETATGFVTVAEVTNAPLPPVARPLVDVTHMQSPGRNRENIAGLGETSEVTFECNFIAGDATQDDLTGVLADLEDSIKRYWQIVYTQGATEKIFRFIGTVSGADIPATPDAALKLSFKLIVNTRIGWF